MFSTKTNIGWKEKLGIKQVFVHLVYYVYFGLIIYNWWSLIKDFRCVTILLFFKYSFEWVHGKFCGRTGGNRFLRRKYCAIRIHFLAWRVYIYARAYKASLIFVINNGLIICSGTSFLVKQDTADGSRL